MVIFVSGMHSMCSICRINYIIGIVGAFGIFLLGCVLGINIGPDAAAAGLKLFRGSSW